MFQSKLYQFEDLPLYNFVKCLINGELKYLKKSKGFIKESKLSSHWNSIFSTYLEKSGDNSQAFLLRSAKEYAILINKVRVIDDSISILSNDFNEIAIQNLKTLGINAVIEDGKASIKSLKAIKIKAKLMILEAQKIKKDLDTFNENGKAESAKEEDFTEILLILSKNQGYQMTVKNTTLSEFVTLLRISKEFNDKNKTA